MQWLRLDKQDKLLIQDGAKIHLSQMSSKDPLSVIAIFGAARQGKSYLMNKLAGEGGCGFAVSNNQDPCTVGVDLATNTKSLTEYCSVDKNSSLLNDKSAQAIMKKNSKVRVGFIDVEGQGDRDAAYDARIATSVLLVAKCVIFNWRDSLQKDKLLDMLGVMCRSAMSVKLNENDRNKGSGGGRVKPFGHLHIVFRDWNYVGDETSVEHQLLDIENEDKEDNIRRNVVRRQLVNAFESVTISLLPTPVERVRDLKKVLSNEILSSEFNDAVNLLREKICAQLISGPRLWSNKPLTGPKISKLVPYIADALNEGKQVLPCSAFQSMIYSELNTLNNEASESLKNVISQNCQEMSFKTSEKMTMFLNEMKKNCLNSIECSTKLIEFKNDIQLELKNFFSVLITNIEKQFQDQVESITDDEKLIEEQLTKFRILLEAAFSSSITHVSRESMWPFVFTCGRIRLEILGKELFETLPYSSIHEITNQFDDLLNQLTEELSSFVLLKINKTEIENALESLRDKSQLLLQELSVRNDELNQSKKEEEQEMCDLAIAALLNQMSEEETKLRDASAAKGQSQACYGLSNDRTEVLVATVSKQLENKLNESGSSDERIGELVQGVMDAGQKKLDQLLEQRMAILEKDISHIAQSQKKWLRSAAQNELLVEAQDETVPVNGVDKRSGLTELLHRLSTAADIAITAIAKMGCINHVNNNEVSCYDHDSIVQFKNELFELFKLEIENEVDELKIVLQQAKEKSNANVREAIKKEELIAQEVLIAKQRLEEEKLKLAAEAERNRLEKEEKKRIEKMEKLKIEKELKEQRRLEKIRLEKEAKIKDKLRLAAAEEAEVRRIAEQEAFKLATEQAEEAALKLAKEKAKEVALKHAKKVQMLRDEKEFYDKERKRLSTSGADDNEEEEDDGRMDLDETEENDIIPLKSSRKANLSVKATPKKPATTVSKSKKSDKGPKLSVAEAKEKMRKEQADRAKKRVSELCPGTAAEESPPVPSGSKRRSVGGTSSQKRSRN